jgi:hypothetical protein
LWKDRAFRGRRAGPFESKVQARPGVIKNIKVFLDIFCQGSIGTGENFNKRKIEVKKGPLTIASTIPLACTSHSSSGYSAVLAVPNLDTQPSLIS